MDSKKLISLVKKDEGVKLDFKLKLSLESESSKKELAKDICAIANSKGGRGYIIIGIEDKTKKIVGLNEKDLLKEEQIQQIISSRCEPPIPITLDTVIIENKKVCVITIYQGEQKPYQIRENGAFYIRRGSTTDTMRKQELIEAFEENLDIFIETVNIAKSDISFLEEELLKKYFKNKGIELNNENKNFLLESAQIINKDKESDKYSCTIGGLLAFSKNNYFWLPQNFIRIINRVNNNYKEVFIVNGTILDMIDNAQKILIDLLPKKYPVSAISEALNNAVLYRDYSIFSKFIEINIGYRTITITNPGASTEKLSQSKRNMWLYEKLITLDNNKRFTNDGRGIYRIKNSFKNKNVKFINSIRENYFKVILPGINTFEE